MEESQFEYLVGALTPMILKDDGNMRECIKLRTSAKHYVI